MWPEMRASRDVPERVNFSLSRRSTSSGRCYIAHSTAQLPAEFEGDYEERVPNMIWGADIGHGEGWWPVNGFPEPAPKDNASLFEVLDRCRVERDAKSIWEGLPAEKLMPYLQDNFFKAYQNFDKVKLQEVANRIGPSKAGHRLDLGQRSMAGAWPVRGPAPVGR